MKAVTKKNDYLKKVFDEAGFSEKDQSSKNTLKFLLKYSDEVSSLDHPPLGYEQDLLNSLKKQMPELSKSKVKSERVGAGSTLIENFFQFLRSPQLSWSVSGTMAIVLVLLVASQKFSFSPSGQSVAHREADLFTQTASRGGEKAASEWLASMGDSGTRAQASRSLSSLAEELESYDSKTVEKVLHVVAAGMGRSGL
jgi:hypothetical protein